MGAAVLAHEIIGFAITGKMDGMPLQLHVMPEVETAGCMPESFTADNKEDLHGVVPVTVIHSGLSISVSPAPQKVTRTIGELPLPE